MLMGTGGVAVGVYLLDMFPKLDAYLPAKLLKGMELMQGVCRPKDYYAAAVVAVVMVVLCMVLAVKCLDRKQL